MAVRYFRGKRGEFFHEHEQLKEIASILNDEFSDEPIYLLTNIKLPRSEIDCIVLTTKGPTIIDVKNYLGEITGDDYPEKPWQVITPDGEVITLHRNLFEQLQNQRGEFNRQYQKIRDKLFQEIDGKEAGRISAWGYFRKGSTYPEGQIDPYRYPWFSVITADNLVEKLHFNDPGYVLLDSDLDLIVQELCLEEYDINSLKKVEADKKPILKIFSGKAEKKEEPVVTYHPAPLSESAPQEPPRMPKVRVPKSKEPVACTTSSVNESDILEEPKPLSEDQRKAVLSRKERVRVMAGAGAGKTETLTRKIVHLLLIEKADPSSIVAFTFTKKAAQNMKSRIYDRVEHFGGVEACSRLGDMYVGTIHGYCLRMLQEHCGYRNYSELDEHQEMAFLLRVGWNFLDTTRGNYAQICDRFIGSLNVMYAEMLDRQVLRENAPEFAKAADAYENEMARYRVISFNRMIDLATRHIAEEPGLVKTIRHLIVDEYQDINRAQEQLISLMGKSARVFVVGDPRQTIYQWRGSDERCFGEFIRTGDVETVTITENRRSGREIIELANSIADRFNEGYKHLVPMRDSESGAFLVEHHSNLSEPEWTAKQIKKMIDSGRCRYQDIAILLRSVRTSAPAFIEEFRKQEIPVIIAGKVGLFDRPEIKAVSKLMLWLPDDGFYQSDNYNELITGPDLLNNGISEWQDACGPILPDEHSVQLNHWRESVRNGEYPNFSAIYYELLNILGYKRLDPDDPTQGVILANLGRYSKLLNDFEASNRFGGAKHGISEMLSWLNEYINAYAALRYEEQSAEDIRKVEAVQIVTIHQAKGLEWPVVFIPAISEYRFPSSKMGEKHDWMIPRELFDAARYEGELVGERKVFYVAATRARGLLVMSYFASMNRKNREPSIFAQEMIREKDVAFISGEEDLPEIMLEPSTEAEEINTYSTGELVSYGRCPHMYRLRSIWNYQSGLVEMMGYGKALHHCLSESAALIGEGKNPVSAVAETVENHFSMPYVNAGKLDKIRKGAKSQLARFASRNERDMHLIKNVEARLEFPTDYATIIGRADVILEDKGGIEVRDYKTSDTVISDEEAAFQVQLYALGFINAGEKVTAGSVAFLRDGAIRMVDVDEKSLKKAENTAVRYLQQINRNDFTARPGRFCSRCDYASICKWKGGTEPDAKVVTKTVVVEKEKNVSAPSFSDDEVMYACDVFERELKSRNSHAALKALKHLIRYTDGEEKETARAISEQLSVRADHGLDVPVEIVHAGEVLAESVRSRR